MHCQCLNSASVSIKFKIEGMFLRGYGCGDCCWGRLIGEISGGYSRPDKKSLADCRSDIHGAEITGAVLVLGQSSHNCICNASIADAGERQQEKS